MVIRNVKYTHTQKMTSDQKTELKIPESYIGLVAIETHNPTYRREAILLREGAISYIKSG